MSIDRTDVPAAAQPLAARPAGGRAGRDARPVLTGALAWACGLAGVVAALGSVRPWARATLADRGADLLVVTRSGWDLPPSGQSVCVLGLVVALVCALASRTGWSRWLRYVLPVAGTVIAVVAVSRLGAGDPVARKLERLRIGTFQTDHPVVAASTGVGLWVSLAAGVVIVVAATAALALDRRARRPAPAAEGR